VAQPSRYRQEEKDGTHCDINFNDTITVVGTKRRRSRVSVTR
jgi:hypothetical protein